MATKCHFLRFIFYCCVVSLVLSPPVLSQVIPQPHLKHQPSYWILPSFPRSHILQTPFLLQFHHRLDNVLLNPQLSHPFLSWVTIYCCTLGLIYHFENCLPLSLCSFRFQIVEYAERGLCERAV